MDFELIIANCNQLRDKLSLICSYCSLCLYHRGVVCIYIFSFISRHLSYFIYSLLVVATSGTGFVLGSGSAIDLAGLCWTCTGTMLVAASANSLNQVALGVFIYLRDCFSYHVILFFCWMLTSTSDLS